MSEFRQLVESSGHPASAAAVLSVLLEVNKATTQQISSIGQIDHGRAVTGLRYWRNRGWLTSSPAQSAGRGRPPHVWSLSSSHVEVCQSLLSDLNRELKLRKGRIARIQRALRSLGAED